MEASSLVPPITEEPANCETHGDYTARYIVIPNGERRGGKCPACVQAAQQVDTQERAARREQLAQEERARSLEAAGVTPRMLGKSFDDFIAESPEQQRALRYCRELVDRVRANPRGAPCLIFAGKPGNGKTHLACAIVQALYGQRNVARRNMADVVDAIRATWSKNSQQSREEVVNRFADLDLLIIDEVGAGYGSDSERAEIFRIIDRRYDRLLPTGIITNLTADELRLEIGERVLDRMREDGGKLLTFTGTSQRKPSP
jgi:DNA replication protein DnaC